MIDFHLIRDVKSADCLLIPLFENKKFNDDIKKIDERFNGLLSRIHEIKDFEGKKMQSSLIYTHEKELPRIMLLGLGNEGEIIIRNWKELVGTGVVAAQNKKMVNLVIVVPESLIEKFGAKEIGRETAVAIGLASYAFDVHKSKDEHKITPIKKVSFLGKLDSRAAQAFKKGIEEGTVIYEAMNWVRHLGNTPPSILHPTYMANEVSKLAKNNPQLKIKILGKKEIEKLGMGLFLAVASGSQHEPKFIIVEYSGGGAKQKPTVLVGKGITFDTGGVNVKPGDNMVTMKFDMLGGATAVGTVLAAAGLGIKKNLVALTPVCENMPSGTAYRPDDIVIAMNGTTVEVGNTDAEGRMVLGDALCYAKKYEPKEIVDFATLTGHCLVAIGNERSGLFTNNQEMADRVFDCSGKTGERYWPLPVGDEFTEAIKSSVADIQNVGGVGHPRYGGASTAAAFLQHFVGDTPWVHIDMASCYFDGRGKPWMRGGANGFGVETFVEYLRGNN